MKSDATNKFTSHAKRPLHRLVVQSVLNVTANDLYGEFYRPEEFRPVPTKMTGLIDSSRRSLRGRSRHWLAFNHAILTVPQFMPSRT